MHALPTSAPGRSRVRLLRDGHVEHQRLGRRELAPPVEAAVVAVARALLPRPGTSGVGVVRGVAVDPDLPGLDAHGYSPALASSVARVHVGRQAVLRVVRQGHRGLLGAVEGRHGHDGPEGLTPRDLHVLGHVGQHRHGEVVPGPLGHAAPVLQLGAGLNGSGDLLLHELPLQDAHHRTDLARLVRTGADLVGLGDLADPLREGLRRRGLHVDALHRAADLAAVEERELHGVLRRPVEVGVGEDHHRVLAA
mmetsp:Transcript_42512/g.132239  ORF Transcript_42512/g.132239 Transcript_42512/m.132239 type:complete len:251 (+) Transcript_42512:3-755(+)